MSDTVGAVDLGSNSFHLVIARTVEGSIHIVHRHRETVRLAAGLDEQRMLSREAQDRGIACLARFGQVLRDVAPQHVRAVGTNTLRRARNGRAFMVRASRALGHQIEVVSGHEEARLIFLGVLQAIGPEGGRRLIVDIGGGSTELILGEGLEPVTVDSLHMGCVTWSRRFFDDGEVTQKRMRRAELAALRELETLAEPYRALGWQDAVGASGTILATEALLRDRAMGEGGISREGLQALRDRLVAVGRASRLGLESLRPDRVDVLPGGLAILSALFTALNVERMSTSSGAMREGVLYDLLGRIHNEDARDRTVARMVERYKPDRAQSGRVWVLAEKLLDQVKADWELDSVDPRALRWACDLHEIGLALNYSGHHKHGAYLVANSDMPGFSREGQELLAALVRAHRRKIRLETFRDLGLTTQEVALRLAVLLRLAALVHRSRSAREAPDVVLEVSGAHLTLHFPADWLEEHPLTRADLDEEVELLAKAGFELSFA